MRGEEQPASQFYTGLVAELYEPLAGYRARAADYLPFIERFGQPVLELGCGSGNPLLEIARNGIEIEGVDSSAVMLERCRERASAEGIDVTLHLAEMQSMDLPRRYRSIFLAGATFTLLPSDDDAFAALERIHDHLEPEGAALIPLALPDEPALERSVGRFRETRSDDGQTLRFGALDVDFDRDAREVRSTLRYERIAPDGVVESEDRVFYTRWWSQDAFRGMLIRAGFRGVRMLAERGGRASDDALTFVALAERGPA